jgi:ethanolamine transporter EutH
VEPLINAILYFVFLFGALFLILGTALVLLIAAALPVIWKKNLSFLMISLGINILVIPLSFFIGGMATDSPGSTIHDFWEVFLFIQIFPFPLVLLSLVWWLVRRKKAKVHV